MKSKAVMEMENQMYIQNKMLEIAIEKARIASEKKNEEIANEANDAYTQELMDAGIL